MSSDLHVLRLLLSIVSYLSSTKMKPDILTRKPTYLHKYSKSFLYIMHYMLWRFM